MFGPALTCIGPAPGTTRTVAASSVAAGLIARSDRSNNPNVAAAGTNGQSRTAIGLAQSFTSAEADALNDGGVNMFRSVYGVIELYGYRSLAPKDDDPEWWQLTAGRLYMAIAAYCEPALQRALFAQLDGTRTRLGQLEGEVGSVLLGLYNQGALYGADPTQAFRVDATSLNVNPDEQLAQGIVKVAVEVRMSPFGEIVRLELMKTSITTPLTV
jgi:phage tail sheath protein FI